MKTKSEQVPVERAHHRYGMSVLNAIGDCPGYTPRGGTNEAAEDGTRLHDIMEQINKHRSHVVTPWTAIQSLEMLLPDLALTEEEHFQVRYCCKELDFWLAKNPIDLNFEKRIEILNPDGTQLNFGHYDLLIRLTEKTAVLLDWKFGWLPVPAAAQNLQGKGYAVGCLQKYDLLEKIGVIFVQPKLNQTTRAFYSRKQLPKMYCEIRDVITAAQSPDKKLHVGPYCDFCGVAATCKALLNEAQRAVAIHEGLPMPQSFVGLQIETPEEAARALYVLDRLEVLLEQSGLKEKAREMARAAGGQLTCKLSDTETVIVDLKQRNAPRSANSPALIADALKDVLTAEQVLSACDPKITRLEEIFADAYVEKTDAEAEAMLRTADIEAAANPKMAKEIIADAKEVRTTKKRAKEILNAALLSEGLISAPEGKVEYLKVRIEKQPKQITSNG